MKRFSNWTFVLFTRELSGFRSENEKKLKTEKCRADKKWYPSWELKFLVALTDLKHIPEFKDISVTYYVQW